MQSDMCKYVSYVVVYLLFLVKQCSGALAWQSIHLSTAHLHCVGVKEKMDRHMVNETLRW